MQYPSPNTSYRSVPFPLEKRQPRLAHVASSPNVKLNAYPPPGQIHRVPYASPRRHKPLPPPLYIPSVPHRELNAEAVQMPDAPTPHPRLATLNRETSRRTRSHHTLHSEERKVPSPYVPPAEQDSPHGMDGHSIRAWVDLSRESETPVERPAARAHHHAARAPFADTQTLGRPRYQSLPSSYTKPAPERIPLGSAADQCSRIKIRFYKVTAADGALGQAMLVTVRGVGVEEAANKWLKLDDDNKQPLAGYKLDKGKVKIQIQWPGYKKLFVKAIDTNGGSIRNVDLVREVAMIVQEWFEYVRAKGKKSDGKYPQWQMDYKNQGNGIRASHVTLVGIQNIGDALWQPMLDWDPASTGHA